MFQDIAGMIRDEWWPDDIEGLSKDSKPDSFGNYIHDCSSPWKHSGYST